MATTSTTDSFTGRSRYTHAWAHCTDKNKAVINMRDHYWFYARKEACSWTASLIAKMSPEMSDTARYHAQLFLEYLKEQPLTMAGNRAAKKFIKEQPYEIAQQFEPFRIALYHLLVKKILSRKKWHKVINDYYRALQEQLLRDGEIYLPRTTGMIQCHKRREIKARIDLEAFRKTGNKQFMPMQEWYYFMRWRRFDKHRFLRDYYFVPQDKVQRQLTERGRAGQDYPEPITTSLAPIE